jgi:hypothetical protein
VPGAGREACRGLGVGSRPIHAWDYRGAGVALAGWLVPGLGQWTTGRRGAGVALFLVIVTLFTSGLALADFACVNPREHKLEFVAHALIGGPTSATLLLTEGRRAGTAPRWRDVGSLYVVVAGFLNLIALTSAAGEAVRQNQERRRKHQEAVRLALAVARLQALARRPTSLDVEEPAPWPPLALPETSVEPPAPSETPPAEPLP